jgi:hypothetical protein
MTPTPAPTPFYQATPTLLFDALAPATPVIQLPSGDVLTSGLVQGYNMANAHSIIDYFWMAVIMLLLILIVWMVIYQFRQL